MDLDGTMLLGDSFRIMLTECYAVSKYLPIILIAFFLRKFRLISLMRFKEISLIPFRGWSRDEINDWGTVFYHSKIKTKLLSGALSVVEFHKTRGDCLVLATGAPDIYLKALVEDLGFDEKICTELEFENDFFTGRINGNDCLGSAKQKKASELASRLGIEMKSSYFYSDHQSDTWLLQLVGNPKIVNPELSFEKYALEHGWQICKWH